MARLIPFDAEMFERARQAPSQRFAPQTFNPNSGPSMQDVAGGIGLAQNVLSPVANAIVSHVGESRRKAQEAQARTAFDLQHVGAADLARKQAAREALAYSNADYAQDAGQRMAQFAQQAPQGQMAQPIAPPPQTEAGALQVEAPPLAGPPDQAGNQQMPPLDWNARKAELAQQMASRRAAQDVPQQAAPQVPQDPMRPAEQAFQGTQPPRNVPGVDVPAPKFMDRDELLVRAYMAGVSGDKAEKQAVLQGFKQLGDAAYGPASIGEAFNPHEARKRALGELVGLMTPKQRGFDPTAQARNIQSADTAKARQKAIEAEAAREAASSTAELEQRKARAERERADADAAKPGGLKDRKRLADALGSEARARNADRLADSLVKLREQQGGELTARQAYEVAKTMGEDERTAQAVAVAYNQYKQGDLAAARTANPERFRSNVTVETPQQRRDAQRGDEDRKFARNELADAEKGLRKLTAEINELRALANGSGKPSTSLLRQYPDLAKATSVQMRKDLAADKLAGRLQTQKEEAERVRQMRQSGSSGDAPTSGLPTLVAP